MIKSYFAILYFALDIMTCSCQAEVDRGMAKIKKESKISRLSKLDKAIKESSGLAIDQDGALWTNNDGGGNNTLYKIDKGGHILESLKISNSSNRDWEDLTSDSNGFLYIGDFGNNNQDRKDLVIYKFKDGKTEEIRFSYQDQEKFPSKKGDFDCEAFFWHNNELHLFTKSWKKKKKMTKHYVIPDKPGQYEISPKDIFAVNETVTSADISPDSKQFALLTYGKVLFFGIENDVIDFKKPIACLKTKRKQTEGLVYSSNNQLLFTNEQRGLYEINLAQND